MWRVENVERVGIVENLGSVENMELEMLLV
jgi:hypothetical protein